MDLQLHVTMAQEAQAQWTCMAWTVKTFQSKWPDRAVSNKCRKTKTKPAKIPIAQLSESQTIEKPRQK